MRYLAKPCDQCPFLRDGKAAVRLTEDRIEEIAGAALDPQGGTFACHKTVDYDDEGEGSGGDHCAGFLCFAEKNGNATQMMRKRSALVCTTPAKMNRIGIWCSTTLTKCWRQPYEIHRQP